jgi:hypothetical protein
MNQFVAFSIYSCSRKQENILQSTPPPIAAMQDGAYGSGGLLELEEQINQW